MKKVLFTIVLLLSAVALQAQVVVQGETYWDGRIRFEATEVDETSGAAHLEGYDIDGNFYQFNLTPGRQDGQYFLNAQGYIPFLRTDGGCEVTCVVEEEDVKFLAPKTKQGRITNVLTCMEEDLYELYFSGIQASEYPVGEMLDSYLMDNQYLCRFSPEELREMKAQLEEMGELSFRGKVNVQLIETELAMNPELRLKPLMSRDEWYAKYGEEFAEGDGDDVNKDADFDEFMYVTVSNEVEFIEALGSNRNVRIADGATLNLSRLLNDEEFFWQSRHTNWVDEIDEFHADEVWIISEQVFDGRQLTLWNVHNLTIQGGNNCKIIVEPRYACVFNLLNCYNITFNNLVLGHTEDGFCMGAVIGVKNSNNVFMYNCDLFGCGTYGIVAEDCGTILMANCDIRECSEGIMWLINSNDCSFVNCDFYDNKSGVATYNTVDVGFNNCRFFRNAGVLFNSSRKIMVDNCEMWQPENERGSVNILSFNEFDYIWNDDRGANETRRNNVGPQIIGEGGLNDDGKGFDEYDPSLSVYFDNWGKILQDYNESATNFEHKTFNKYAPIDLDGDGTPEICFRNRDNKHGAWFGQQAGIPVFFGLETQDMYADVLLEGNWMVFRGNSGDAQVSVLVQIVNSTLMHTLATRKENGVTGYNLDGKEITEEQANKIIHRGIKWNFGDWQPEWFDLPE